MVYYLIVYEYNTVYLHFQGEIIEYNLTAEEYENCLVKSSLNNIVAAGTSPQRVKQGYPRANQDDFSVHGSILPDYPENIIDFDIHMKI